MIEVVCEFVIKEEARGQFELAYGPGGLWSKLYAQRAGFRGTTLMRDMKNPGRYLTVDLWDTEAQRDQTLSECKTEYSYLEATLADWSESKTEVGIFRVLAEGTVRPRGKTRPSKSGKLSRRRH